MVENYLENRRKQEAIARQELNKKLFDTSYSS